MEPAQSRPYSRLQQLNQYNKNKVRSKPLMSNKDVSIIIVDDMQFSRVVIQAALKKPASAIFALPTVQRKPLR